ncbi:MAG TPA: AAA family ATPase, partial [Polyangiaceae bacterium]|nr:AAA family ATPase [Polyangiaceae bacterium]
RGGNSWTAWRDVTPKHNALVDALLNYPGHVIATMRQKMEHVQEPENGRTVIKKVGLAAIQREGMEYEFDLVGDIDATHTLRISKTRLDTIALGEQIEKPGADFARRLFNWLMDGKKPESRPAPVEQPRVSMEVADAPAALESAMDRAFALYLTGIETAPDLATLDKKVNGPGRPAKGTEQYERAIAKAQERAAFLRGAAA